MDRLDMKVIMPICYYIGEIFIILLLMMKINIMLLKRDIQIN